MSIWVFVCYFIISSSSIIFLNYSQDILKGQHTIGGPGEHNLISDYTQFFIFCLNHSHLQFIISHYLIIHSESLNKKNSHRFQPCRVWFQRPCSGSHLSGYGFNIQLFKFIHYYVCIYILACMYKCAHFLYTYIHTYAHKCIYTHHYILYAQILYKHTKKGCIKLQTLNYDCGIWDLMSELWFKPCKILQGF